MSSFDLFDIHDSMHDIDCNTNDFQYNEYQSFYNDYLSYVYEQEDDSDYHRYRYY